MASRSVSSYLFKTNPASSSETCSDDEDNYDHNLLLSYALAAGKSLLSLVVSKILKTEYPWVAPADEKPSEAPHKKYLWNAAYVLMLTNLILYLPSYSPTTPSVTADYSFPSILPVNVILVTAMARLILSITYCWEKITFKIDNT